jgi:succinoglycan biosynthesis protein ExoO
MFPDPRRGSQPDPAGVQPPATPLVTVVMANHNGGRYIETALRAVLGQSLRDIDVIVADDCSTDDSAERVTAIASHDRRVRLLLAHRNEGPAAARNRGLDAARGRWIAVLDSDDMMHPERLSRLVAAAEQDGADIIRPPRVCTARPPLRRSGSTPPPMSEPTPCSVAASRLVI